MSLMIWSRFSMPKVRLISAVCLFSEESRALEGSTYGIRVRHNSSYNALILRTSTNLRSSQVFKAARFAPRACSSSTLVCRVVSDIVLDRRRSVHSNSRVSVVQSVRIRE